MKKFKNIVKSLLLSHIFWAIISFGFILLFTGLTQYDYGWNWKTNALIVSSILFALFSFGAVGLSIFNLIINIIRRIVYKIRARSDR